MSKGMVDSRQHHAEKCGLPQNVTKDYTERETERFFAKRFAVYEG